MEKKCCWEMDTGRDTAADKDLKTERKWGVREEILCRQREVVLKNDYHK